MNYLAHLFFSKDSTDSMLGSLLGDFVKGDISDRFNREVRDGIKIHRMIDKYTDAHDTVMHSRNVISAQRRRYAGIMIDVFYDHFLALHWSRFSGQCLQDFANNCYIKLDVDAGLSVPDSLRRTISGMTQYNGLTSYARLDGIEKAIDRISARMRFQNNLRGGAQELLDNYDVLERDFLEFFPQLRSHVGQAQI